MNKDKFARIFKMFDVCTIVFQIRECEPFHNTKFVLLGRAQPVIPPNLYC